MKKRSAQIKRRIKQRSKMVRVIGAMQPPEETISEKELSKFDPYITDTELADWAQDFQKRVQHEKPIQSTEENAIYLSLVLSETQCELFSGVYEATKENPIYAMEAFVAAHHLGLYPPLWVLDWLYEAFVQYLISPAENDIAKLLLIKRGKGKAAIKKEYLRVQLENAAMNQILFLKLSGKSIEEVAAIVSEDFEAKGIIDCPTAETLAERFTKRGWSKALEQLRKDLTI
jgi:hypothetical protein